MHLALGLEAAPTSESHTFPPLILSATSDDIRNTSDLSKEDRAREVRNI